MKSFNVITTGRAAVPRSRRLRESGGYPDSGSPSVVFGGDQARQPVAGDGHTHDNKPALDAISIDDGFYLWLKQKMEGQDDSTLEKVKAGYADDAGHANNADHALDADTWAGHAFADWLDQSVRKGDAVEFAQVLSSLFRTPDFAPGLTGFGAEIDADGNGSMESLSLRRFLEVPELRYNRVTIQVGNHWRAPGGGIIERVEVDQDADGNRLNTGIIHLHLQDGEIGTVELDDICMGIFHDGMALGNNATVNSDDGIGNFHFSGFYTCYFRVTEILSANNSSFRYALRPVSDRWKGTMHPCMAMHFVGYGNFDGVNHPERQTSRYSTLTYERFLRNVNNWEFTADNIAAQFGDLSNLSVYGMNMSGYSAYLNNIYMSGVIQQFENLPYRMEIDTEGEDTLAYGESLHVTCRVFKGWDDVTEHVVSWSIVRDSGDPMADRTWKLKDKARNFAGTIDIVHGVSGSDLGSIGISTLFTIKADLSNGGRATYTLQV